MSLANLLIILILAVVGALPVALQFSWGYYPTGGLGLLS